MKKTIVQVLIAVTVLMIGTACYAQDNKWNMKIVPYAWLAGMEGEVGVAGRTSSINKDFSEILEDLSFAAFLTLDANNNTWGVLVDLNYVGLDDSRNTGAGEFRVDIDQGIISAVPYYKVILTDEVSLDLGVGGRYIDIDVESSTPFANRSASKGWADPIALVRLQVPVTEQINLTFIGDVGGFGVSSDITWQLAATASYSITSNVDLMLGYRYFGYDYEEDNFSYDLDTSGLGLGIIISL